MDFLNELVSNNECCTWKKETGCEEEDQKGPWEIVSQSRSPSARQPGAREQGPSSVTWMAESTPAQDAYEKRDADYYLDTFLS